jgi:toxin CptA
MSLPPPRVRPLEGGDLSGDGSSIAVSAVVKPSRIVKLLCLTLSVMLFITAFALLFLSSPDISLLVRSGLSGSALVAAVAALLQAVVPGVPVSLDISGLGQIRRSFLFVRPTPRSAATAADIDCLVQLQPGTLMFSTFLLLRLKDNAGVVSSLLILPDAISTSGFRRLSVACRWIAAQNYRAAETIHE